MTDTIRRVPLKVMLAALERDLYRPLQSAIVIELVSISPRPLTIWELADAVYGHGRRPRSIRTVLIKAVHRLRQRGVRIGRDGKRGYQIRKAA